MAVLGRLLVGSAQRLDLPDLLSVESYVSSDFQYLIKSFVGGDKPFVLKGFDVIDPQNAIGTENVSIRIADSVVYYPGSNAASFYYGLPEGNVNALPLIPELRKNATNFVYLTFSTFNTALDARAYWDPDANDGAGGEFTQDVNTQTALTAEVNVSVSTFPANTIPICKVVVGASVITSIQDCRDLMFRLGSGGIAPDAFNSFSFRNEPSIAYARSEPPSLMTSSANPNAFQGGDKNIFSLKEWMDVVMTKLKEVSGSTYWYENAGSSGGTPVTVNNVFQDALASTIKSKGQWEHSGSVAGQVTWTENINYLSLRDPRELIVRANTITLGSEDVAWIEMDRDIEINNSSQPVDWFNATTFVNGVVGAFANLTKGDWVKKKPDAYNMYLRVEEFYAGPTHTLGPASPAFAQSIELSEVYAGSTGSEIGEYSKGEFLLGDINITSKDDASIQTAGGNFYWLAYRSDTCLGLSGAAVTSLTVDVTEADGQRARVTSTVAHGLIDGDRITITGGAYTETYKVEVIDTDDFYIETAVIGNSLAQPAFYAIVTTAARSTPHAYSLETANHGFKSDEKVTIQNTATAFDGSYFINVRTATTFQIPFSSFVVNPGAVSGEIVCLPRVNVRTEFGTSKVVQGEEVNIGESDSQNILSYVGMDSVAQTSPDYFVPPGTNTLAGYQNFNSLPTDNLTIRAARLTAMMAGRVQDHQMQIIGRTNILNETNGANQDISALSDLTLVRPSSADQTITLTSVIALPANSAIVIDFDRNGSATIVPSVISLGNNLLISDNRFILFYRFGTTDVYDWKGNKVGASGHLNTEYPEDSQNRNVTVFNPGTVQLDSISGLLTIKIDEVSQITEITTLDGATTPQSSHFFINSANDATEYYVWYDIDSLGVDPTVGGKTGIVVSITSGDSATDVATATAFAINSIAGADFTATSLLDVVTVANDNFGICTAAADVDTTFSILVTQTGFNPDIQVIIPGSANNRIDVDAINTLGTLVIGDGQAVWIRINRFAVKTFDSIFFTDIPDTDANGALYVTNTASVPIDQDVFVLWNRVGSNILATNHADSPTGNIYEEYIDIISGIPSNSNELQGPMIATTLIPLPLDSRDANSIQEYVTGSGQLKVFLNGQSLRIGVDYNEVGDPGSLNNKIEILQSLVVFDTLGFRLDAQGSVFFASGGGGGAANLQEAYDGGRFVTVITGQPIVISGPSGKLLSVQGDMDVTGVIDPAGITFSQEAVDPLDTNDYGIWRNASDQFIFKHGANPAINLSTEFMRRDGSSTSLANMNLNNFKIINLGTPTLGADATNKNYVDTLGTAFIRRDGTQDATADIGFGGFKVANIAAPTVSTDATNKNYVDTLVTSFIKRDGTLAATADISFGGFKAVNVATPVAATDVANKDYVDTLGTAFIRRDGTLNATADINFGGFKVVNIAAPTLGTDAVNKTFLETNYYQKTEFVTTATAGAPVKLDGGGKISATQLPSSVMTYEGTFDASATPATPLLNGDLNANAGMVYLASIAGTYNFGAGGIVFALGDWAVYNGSIWEKSLNSNAVVSVNSATGVVTVNAINQLTGDVTTTAATASESKVATISNNAVTSAKIASTAFDGITITGGGGSAAVVQQSPKSVRTVVAGESMAANTSFLVRWAKNGETAGRVYKADKDATTNENFYAWGITLNTSSVVAGDSINVVFEGTHTLGGSDVAFNAADIGLPVYLTSSGGFSITPSSTVNDAVWRVGIVQSVSSIWVGDKQLNAIN